MVVILQGSEFRKRTTPQQPKENFDRFYSDKYPVPGFRPGQPLHEFMVGELLLRGRESERLMSPRHPEWTKLDETLRAFIPLDKGEDKLKKKDSRTPVSIVIPESYATLETLLTAMMSIFGRVPLFQVEGVGPEDIFGAIMLEKLLEYQTEFSKMLLPLHTQWRDAFTYGIGANTLVWTVKTGKRSVFSDLGFFDPLVPGGFVKTGSEREVVDAILYEGNSLESIDPYKILPDPTAQLHDVQAGEYFGWLDTNGNYPALLRAENEPESMLFNIRYLRNRDTSRSSIFHSDESGREPIKRREQRHESGSGLTQPVDIMWMYIDLIPAEMRAGDGSSSTVVSSNALGSSDLPEKWLFGLAADEIIVSAHKMDLHHNMFPVSICAPDFGGHEFTPVSRLEIMQGMQTLANFYVNSHVEFARRAARLNLLVDPKLVNWDDVLQGNGAIRTRRPVWGRGVQGAIEQIKLTDVTGNHMRDLAQLQQISRQSTGAVDALQGQQRASGERVTRGEFEGTRSAALSRIGKAARIISLQSLTDIGLMMGFNTQQFMTEETFLKVAGRTKQVLQREYGITGDRMKVSPFDINIAFDIRVQDGSIGDGASVADWLTLYQIMAQNPEVGKNINDTRVWLHIARLMGTDDAHEFLDVQVDVQPDERIAEQAQAGNIVPLEEAAAL